MKISELPKEIREKALKYQSEEKLYHETDELYSAFSWANTEEGSVYWSNLSRQKPKEKERMYSKEELKEAYKKGYANGQMDAFIN